MTPRSMFRGSPNLQSKHTVTAQSCQLIGFLPDLPKSWNELCYLECRSDVIQHFYQHDNGFLCKGSQVNGLLLSSFRNLGTLEPKHLTILSSDIM